MIQIIAGKLKGRKLKTPSATTTRPTSAKVREAIFNILGPRVQESRFLDLFAGSGAIGIEAYSRGAKEVVFVEKNPAVSRLLKENLAFLSPESSELKSFDSVKAIAKLGEEGKSFDIIFIDPPYGQGWIETCCRAIAKAGILQPGGLILAEESSRVQFQENLESFSLIKKYLYGDTCIYLFGWAEKGYNGP